MRKTASRASSALVTPSPSKAATSPATTLAKAAEGRVFYVDSVAGNDANKGDSPALAWASLEQVNDAELQPGDTVRFKRGGVWRGIFSRENFGEVVVNQPVVRARNARVGSRRPRPSIASVAT